MTTSATWAGLGQLSTRPFIEKPVDAAADAEASKAARQRLTAVLAELNPPAGKTDKDGGGTKKKLQKKQAKKAIL